MAWTQIQIDALKTAMSSGVLTVKHGETLTTFRSFKEMKALLDSMESELNGIGRPRRTVAAFGNGC